MARFLIVTIAAVLGLAGAFAPPVGMRPAVAVKSTVEETELMAEVEALLEKSMNAGVARMEAKVKDLTADIDAAEKKAGENAIATRLDKIEEMVSDIARKLA